MSGSFSRVTDKQRRAKKHIGEVKELLEGFLDREPYTLSYDHQVYSAETVIVEAKMWEKRLPPLREIADSLGDAVHNLRGTLDYLVWELTCRRLRKRPVDIPLKDPLRRVQFPIFLDPDRFEPKKKSGVRAEGGGAIDMLAFVTAKQFARIKALQPFGDPDHALWVLSELENIDKHRHAHFMAGVHKVGLDRKKPFDGKLISEYAHPGGTIQDKTVVARVRVVRRAGFPDPRDVIPEVDMRLKRTFYVAFGKGSPAEGRDIREILRWLQTNVTRVINKFRDDLPEPLRFP